MRHAARVDSTQQEIVNALRQVGAQVLILNKAIDMLVLYRGKVYVYDPKSEDGRLTATQRWLVAEGWPIVFPRTVDEALAGIGIELTAG